MDSSWFSHCDVSVSEQTPVTFTVDEFSLGFDKFFPLGILRDFELLINRFFVTIGNRYAGIFVGTFVCERVIIIVETATKAIVVVIKAKTITTKISKVWSILITCTTLG